MTDFRYTGTELDAVSKAANYYSFIARRFGPYLGAKVLEIGAGIGTFSEVILAAPSVRELTAVEPASNNISVLERRLVPDSRVRVVAGYIEDVPDEFVPDSVVAVNVLEHMEDPSGFLAAAWQRLRPGGYLLLFVPALQFLFGSLDREFGHFRRYSRGALRAALGSAGFRTQEIGYFNSVGAVAWFVLGRIVGARTITTSQVTIYDRWVVPWVLRADSFLHPPFGQSLLAIARRADMTESDRR